VCVCVCVCVCAVCGNVRGRGHAVGDDGRHCCGFNYFNSVSQIAELEESLKVQREECDPSEYQRMRKSKLHLFPW